MLSYVERFYAVTNLSFSFSRYDLMVACEEIGMGKLHVPELLGDVQIRPISPEGAYDVKLDSKRVQNEHILQLLRRYTGRKSFSER